MFIVLVPGKEYIKHFIPQEHKEKFMFVDIGIMLGVGGINSQAQ